MRLPAPVRLLPMRGLDNTKLLRGRAVQRALQLMTEMSFLSRAPTTPHSSMRANSRDRVRRSAHFGNNW
jgi:hypothetical protein